MVTWFAMGERHTDLRFRASRGSVGDVWNGVDGTWVGDATAKGVYPLVVLDPENREQVERLRDRLYLEAAKQETAVCVPRGEMGNVLQATLRSLVEQSKCKAALNIKGEHFGCDLEPGHILAHNSTTLGAIWQGDES